MTKLHQGKSYERRLHSPALPFHINNLHLPKQNRPISFSQMASTVLLCLGVIVHALSLRCMNLRNTLLLGNTSVRSLIITDGEDATYFGHKETTMHGGFASHLGWPKHVAISALLSLLIFSIFFVNGLCMHHRLHTSARV